MIFGGRNDFRHQFDCGDALDRVKQRAPGADAGAKSKERHPLRRRVEQQWQMRLEPFVASRSGAAKHIIIVQLDSAAVSFLDDGDNAVAAFRQSKQLLALVGLQPRSRHAERIPENQARGGQAASTFALYKASMRRALGIRRSWRQKVAPFTLLGVVTIPAR